MKSFLDTFLDGIDRVNATIGRVSAWLVVGLVGLTLYDVTMRYLFRSGSIAAQELEWHFFGMIILLGAAWTLQRDEHVRVDVFYASSGLSDRHRALIDIAGNLLFLLPFAVLIIWSSVPFVYDAYVRGEISPDPGGLSHRWLLKAAIPLGFGMLAAQALVNTIRTARTLLRPGA